MNTKLTGGPAFPQPDYMADGSTQTEGDPGMTLRDYFAAAFVSSGHVFRRISEGNTPGLVAQQAYVMADAMLEARNAAQ